MIRELESYRRLLRHRSFPHQMFRHQMFPCQMFPCQMFPCQTFHRPVCGLVRRPVCR